MFRLRKPSRAAPIVHHSIVAWAHGQVRASVVELNAGSAQMMGVATVPLEGSGANGLPDVDQWVARCDDALTQSEDMTVRFSGRKLVPDWVTMSVPAEISRSHPVLVRRTRKEPDSRITHHELQGMLRLGYRVAQDEIAALSDDPGEDLVFGSVAEILLDDQVVPDPLGLQGAELQMRLHFSLAPLAWIRALEIVSERLGLRLRSIVPQHAACASPLMDSASLLILVAPTVTAVSGVRRGRLEWSAFADLGAAQVLDSAGEAVGMRGPQVLTLMEAYREGRLQGDVEGRLAQAFWVELREWLRSLATAMAPHAQAGPLPHRIFILDATEQLPEAAPSLETPFWEGLLPFDRCPEIITLESGMVHNVLDLTARADGAGYLWMRALAHLVARNYASEENLDNALVDIICWRSNRRS